MAKERPLSPEAQEVLEFLREDGSSLTLQEINAKTGKTYAPAHLRALQTRGYIGVEKVEKEVIVIKEVNSYFLNETEAVEVIGEKEAVEVIGEE